MSNNSQHIYALRTYEHGRHDILYLCVLSDFYLYHLRQFHCRLIVGTDTRVAHYEMNLANENIRLSHSAFQLADTSATYFKIAVDGAVRVRFFRTASNDFV